MTRLQILIACVLSFLLGLNVGAGYVLWTWWIYGAHTAREWVKKWLW